MFINNWWKIRSRTILTLDRGAIEILQVSLYRDITVEIQILEP